MHKKNASSNRGEFTTTVESQNKIISARFVVVIPLLRYEAACEPGVLKIANSITVSTVVKPKFPKEFKGLSQMKNKTVNLHIDRTVKPVNQSNSIPLAKRSGKCVNAMLQDDIIEPAVGPNNMDFTSLHIGMTKKITGEAMLAYFCHLKHSF